VPRLAVNSRKVNSTEIVSQETFGAENVFAADCGCARGYIIPGVNQAGFSSG
jgi:hypothetical protein